MRRNKAGTTWEAPGKGWEAARTAHEHYRPASPSTGEFT